MIGRVNTGGGGTGGTLTVTAPANVTVTVSKDGKTKTKNSGTSGVVVFKGLASFATAMSLAEETPYTLTFYKCKNGTMGLSQPCGAAFLFCAYLRITLKVTS